MTTHADGFPSGAAAFAAARAYEQKQEREGKPANHALAKELLAAFAGAEVDKLAETKGLSFLDREKAKHEGESRSCKRRSVADIHPAKKQAEAALAQSGQY